MKEPQGHSHLLAHPHSTPTSTSPQGFCWVGLIGQGGLQSGCWTRKTGLEVLNE